MADLMPSSSFLPTIKCSNCAKDIQIAMMGEHICSDPPAGEGKFEATSYVVRYILNPFTQLLHHRN